jgi:aminoglycoside 6-adenylyltransferase
VTPADSFGELTDRIAAWAQAQTDIRGLLIVGSRARTKRPADPMSDLDLIMITTNPSYYLKDTGWFERFGPILLTFVERTAVGGLFERRVLFKGSLDVDFTIFPSDAFHKLQEVGLPPEMQGILRRGINVLIDKDELLQNIAVSPEGTPSPPSAEQFGEHLDDFLYHAVWAAKKLRRGELWVAKVGCDMYMKILLLRMIEWHSRAIHGWDYDTWFGGRFLERWAEPEVLAELAKAFAHYDADDIKSALLQTMLIHRRLSIETGAKLGYHVSAEKYSEILKLVTD